MKGDSSRVTLKVYRLADNPEDDKNFKIDILKESLLERTK